MHILHVDAFLWIVTDWKAIGKNATTNGWAMITHLAYCSPSYRSNLYQINMNTAPISLNHHHHNTSCSIGASHRWVFMGFSVSHPVVLPFLAPSSSHISWEGRPVVDEIQKAPTACADLSLSLPGKNTNKTHGELTERQGVGDSCQILYKGGLRRKCTISLKHYWDITKSKDPLCPVFTAAIIMSKIIWVSLLLVVVVSVWCDSTGTIQYAVYYMWVYNTLSALHR